MAPLTNMVRENSSTLSPDSFSDDAPASDDDPYSTPTETDISFDIDTSKLPKPMPILGPLLGFNEKLLRRLVSQRMHRATTVLQRPITAEEATAMAYWTAKSVSILSYSGPIGMAAGAWRAYRTADSFRVPFFRPNLEKFNPTVFPAARLALLSGPRAVLAWHLCRLFAYGSVGNILGRLLGASYSLSVQSVGEATDPRLKDYAQGIRKHQQAARGRLPNHGGSAEAIGGVQQQSTSRDQQREIDDDPSPTGGSYDDTDPRSGDIPVTPEKEISKRPVMSSQGHDRTGQANGLQGQRSPPFDFNDASVADGGDPGTTGPVGGSVWERIRQQAGPHAADGRGTISASSAVRTRVRSGHDDQEERRPARRREGQDATSRSTVKGTVDGEIPREKAQQEFDARVERERRGGEFSGDPKGW